MMDHTNLHKEIDLIQGCINRMASNSFMVKKWAISLIAVVLALTADRLNPLFLLCSVIVPIIVFWYLDAFFLHTEKKYRKMYEWVLAERKNGSLESQYDLNPHRFKVNSLFRVILSKTLITFYGIPLLAVLFMTIWKFCKY